LVAKEINGNASHFKEIFPSQWPETAPIGIFWTGGIFDSMNHYDYLTNQSMEEISNNVLFNLNRAAFTTCPQQSRFPYGSIAPSLRILCSFGEQG